jgi:hypothetical protein
MDTCTAEQSRGGKQRPRMLSPHHRDEVVLCRPLIEHANKTCGHAQRVVCLQLYVWGSFPYWATLAAARWMECTAASILCRGRMLQSPVLARQPRAISSYHSPFIHLRVNDLHHHLFVLIVTSAGALHLLPVPANSTDSPCVASARSQCSCFDLQLHFTCWVECCTEAHVILNTTLLIPHSMKHTPCKDKLKL